MKRYLSILLAIVLLVVQVPSVGLAVPADITVKDIKISNIVNLSPNDDDISKVYANGTFDLTIPLVTKSGLSDVKDLAVKIMKNSDFKVLDSTSEQEAIDDEVKFKLEYKGGSDAKLPIIIYYKLKDDSSFPPLMIEDSIGISAIFPSSLIPDDDTTTPSPDPGPLPDPIPEDDGSKDLPSISIVSSKTALGESGSTISVPIEIKNNGNHLAENLSTTIELEGDSPLYIDGPAHSNVSRLYPGRSQYLSFNVKADKMAEDKTYPITVNFQYYNRAGVPFTSSDTVYVKITDDKSSAQVIVNRVDIKPAMDIQPGGMVTVGFEVENKGDQPAKDVKISLNGLASDGFSLASGLNNQSIPLLERGKTRYLYFQIKASKKMTSGSHELEMLLSYKNMKNEEVVDENKFFIPIASNKNQSSNLIIQNIEYPTGSIGINKDVNVSFSIKNQGQTKAQNIIITAESTDQAGLVPKSVSVIKLNSLEPGGIEEINYKFLTTGSAETKNYPINISVDYEDDLSGPEERSSVNQFLGIFVVAPDEPGDPIQSTPRLIIDKYVFEPTLVQAGTNFEMHLSFFNTNSSKTVKNIKIFLTAEENAGGSPNSPSTGGSVFTPVDSSNTFYIDSIPPKARVEKTITMFTIPDAIAKTHMITANFEYEDTAGEAYTATELIGVPVIQQSRLEVGEVGYMPEAYVGDYSPISLEFYNTGKVTLYNMMVKLEGDFQTESGSYYIGNFESGSSEYFEGMVLPSEPGPLEGEVVFTYEDSTGQEQEVRKEFTLNVMGMPMMEEFPEDFPPMDQANGGIKGLLTSKWLWGSIILIGGGFGGFKFWKKKKEEKDNEELALDE